MPFVSDGGWDARRGRAFFPVGGTATSSLPATRGVMEFKSRMIWANFNPFPSFC